MIIASPSRVLFLCTGNYYRSRYAEVLFNHLAAAQGLAWRADSAGLRVRPDGVVNVGPISPFAVEQLERRGIPLPETRFPRQVMEADLEGAARIIAIKEMEHRPLMVERFPRFADLITYWNVGDLDVALPDQAMEELDALIGELVRRLGSAA